MDDPITFSKKSYALFDLDANAVLTTAHGNLAIFSTQGMADAFARSSKRRIQVRPVFVTPAEQKGMQ